MSLNRTIAELKRQTAALIAEEGRSVVLQRPGGFERTPEGGQKRSGLETALSAQRMWFKGVRFDSQTGQTSLGETEVNQFTLVGRTDADVQQDDTTTLDGRNFKVLWVHEDTRYEKRARLEEIA